MKKTNIAYWIFTALIAAFILFTAIPNIMVNQDSIKLFNYLGYPTYIIPFLGLAKAAAAITLLIPGFPRLKEWAYAGITFDLAGAFYSIIRVGGADAAAMTTFILCFAVLAISYILHHKRLKMLTEKMQLQPQFRMQGA